MSCNYGQRLDQLWAGRHQYPLLSQVAVVRVPLNVFLVSSYGMHVFNNWLNHEIEALHAVCRQTAP